MSFAFRGRPTSWTTSFAASSAGEQEEKDSTRTQPAFETAGVITPNLDLEKSSRLVARLNGLTHQIKAELEQAAFHLDKAEHAGTMVRAISSKHKQFLPPFPGMKGMVKDRYFGYKRGRWPKDADYEALF